MNSRFGNSCFSIELAESAKQFLRGRGVSAEYGARELKRTVYRYLTQPLATMVAENRVPAGSSAMVEAGPDDNLHFEVDTRNSEPQRPTVLIVDDNKPLLKFLRAVTSNEGWEIVTATSAEKTLKEAETRAINVALIDYMLPDLDGVSLSKKLRTWMP